MPNQKSVREKKTSYKASSSLGAAKANEFPLIRGFHGGYRNREDITVLPPNIMVVGSQNVLTNTFERLGIRRGYTLDGQANVAIAPILSSFDWQRHTGDTAHLRAGFNTSGVNGKLQFRYVAAAGDQWMGNVFTEGQVFWIDLMTGLSLVNFNFTDFWDFNTELISLLLFVNGSSNIFDWSGATTTLLSATVNTITKTGIETWAEIGALKNGGRAVLINGNVYTYTGGEGTTTLTGVAPSPAAEPVQSVIVQQVRTTANAAIAGLPATFKNTLIANLRNQIYIAAEKNQSVYVSKTNNFKDYTFGTPRLVGEGAILTLDGVPTALSPQQSYMYISAGQDQWYATQFQLSADNTAESLTVDRLKTTGLQASQSQAWTTKIKNRLCFLSFEPIFNTLGTEQNYLNDPQTSDISYPIVNDMNGYSFTDGSLIYFKQFVYIAVPQESKVLIYNMTDPSSPYWEAPQVLPISRFSVIDGELYGHSYQVGETYKLFNGFNDNGQPITAIATFAFNNFGTRSASKSFNEFYVEGYISQNGTLTLGIQYDVDGCSTDVAYPILGTDRRIVCLNTDSNSLGKKSLGKFPLGGNLFIQSSLATPPKFRVIKTFPRVPFYEEQTTFSSDQIDFRWELIAFGGSGTPTSEGNNPIKE